MKKIGIITYHNAKNYGAIFQSYALSRYLKDLGRDVEIINYNSQAIEKGYNYKKFSERTSIKNYFAHNITCFLRRKKKRLFNEFLNNMPLSKQYSKSGLNDCNDYDVYITGSDQVFNANVNKNDASFFLDFVSNKTKCSYAASMGSIKQFEESNIDPISYLRSFDYLSVREPDAADYLSNKLERECLTVIDPVWLLSMEQWNRLIVNSKEKSPYILVYNLMDYKYMRDYVKELSKKTGYKVIVVNKYIIGDYMYWGVAKNKSNSSPSEFLSLIKNAEFFVTDSFHGTSLAIILETRFAVALNKNAYNTNSRITNILNLSELASQVIEEGNQPFENSIDFNKAKERMSDFINNSKKYLERIVE